MVPGPPDEQDLAIVIPLRRGEIMPRLMADSQGRPERGTAGLDF